MNKYKVLIYGLLLVFLIFSCSGGPEIQVVLPINRNLINREIIPPDNESMKKLEEASNRARTLKQEMEDTYIDYITPADWVIVDNLLTQAEQNLSTFTLREIQESIARYNYATEAFEALSMKTLSMNKDLLNVEFHITKSTQEDLLWIEEIEIAQVAVVSQRARSGLAASAAARAALQETQDDTPGTHVNPPPQVIPIAPVLITDVSEPSQEILPTVSIAAAITPDPSQEVFPAESVEIAVAPSFPGAPLETKPVPVQVQENTESPVKETPGIKEETVILAPQIKQADVIVTQSKGSSGKLIYYLLIVNILLIITVPCILFIVYRKKPSSRV